jgi:hypothetical protein
MQMPGFIGGSAQAASRSLDVERTINAVTMVGDSGTPKVSAGLTKRMGCRPWVDLLSGPVRGLYALNGTRAWAVAGAFLYELFANQTALQIGSVVSSSLPASWACNGANGNQLLVNTQPNGYVFDLVTGAFTQVTAAGYPSDCAMVAECAGYGLALTSKSNQFNVSAPEDFTAWDGLDFGRVQTNDPLVAMISANNLVYLLGGQRSQVWYPSGDTFPFTLVQGGTFECGTAAQFGPCAIGTSPNATIIFPSLSSDGHGLMYALNGYSPQIISSFAVSTILQAQPILSNMVTWTYQHNGHTFALLYLPNNDTTWVFDTAAPAGMNWSEQGIWNSSTLRWTPHIGRCHCFAFGKHLVGARNSGTIYEMSPAFYADEIVA